MVSKETIDIPLSELKEPGASGLSLHALEGGAVVVVQATRLDPATARRMFGNGLMMVGQGSLPEFVEGRAAAASGDADPAASLAAPIVSPRPPGEGAA